MKVTPVPHGLEAEVATTWRRARIILYEGDDAAFEHQFGTPEAPRGLLDGEHHLAARIRVYTLNHPDHIERLVRDYVDAELA